MGTSNHCCPSSEISDPDSHPTWCYRASLRHTKVSSLILLSSVSSPVCSSVEQPLLFSLLLIVFIPQPLTSFLLQGLFPHPTPDANLSKHCPQKTCAYYLLLEMHNHDFLVISLDHCILTQCLQNSFILQHVSIFHLLLLNNILFMDIRLFLSIHGHLD